MFSKHRCRNLFLFLIWICTHVAISYGTTRSFRSVLDEAKQRKTLVIADFYTEWCSACKTLDAQVLNRSDVKNILKKHVFVKYDAEKGEGETLAQKYNVVGYPSILILRADGSEIERIFGTLPAREFKQTLKDYARGKGTLEDYMNQLAADPGSIKLNYEVGFRWTLRGNRLFAEQHLQKVIDLDPSNKSGFAAQAYLSLGKYLYLRGQKDYRQSYNTLTDLMVRYPETQEATRSVYPLARALKGLDRFAEIETMFTKNIEANPDSVSGYNAFGWFAFKEQVLLKEALAVCLPAAIRLKNSAGLWDTLGEIYYKMGKQKEAIDAMKNAIVQQPKVKYFRSQLLKFSESGS